MTSKNKQTLIFIFTAIVLLIVIVFSVDWLVGKGFEYLAKEARAKIAIREALLQKEFQLDISRAKRATSDPCAGIFYETVFPPKGLEEKPVLVMMGGEVSGKYDQSLFHLVPTGDKVELWYGYSEYTRYKWGEKHSSDSKFCRERK